MIDSVEFIKCLVNWMNGIKKKDRLGTKLQVSPFPSLYSLGFLLWIILNWQFWCGDTKVYIKTWY